MERGDELNRGGVSERSERYVQCGHMANGKYIFF